MNNSKAEAMTHGRDLAVLTFMLGDQYYALPIANVAEVAAMVELTALANARPEVLGAANRHGSVLPMFDLRIIMNHEERPVDDMTLFVVAGTDNNPIGLVVDQILQVEYLPGARIKTAGAGQYIYGIITDAGRMIQILDLDSIVETYLSDTLVGEGHD